MLPELLGIPTLGLCLAAAYVTSLLVLRGCGGRVRGHGHRLLPLLATAALLGGRAAYLAEYETVTIEAMLDFERGSSLFGSVGAMFAVAVAYCHRYGIRLRELGDAIALCVPAHAVARLGCFLAGDGCYGIETDSWLGMSFPNGVVPTEQTVHPVPLYEVVACLVIWAVLLVLRARPGGASLGTGRYFATYTATYAVFRFGTEFLRGHIAYGGLTVPQYASCALLAVAIYLFVRPAAVEKS